jgi:hypothetical protein
LWLDVFYLSVDSFLQGFEIAPLSCPPYWHHAWGVQSVDGEDGAGFTAMESRFASDGLQATDDSDDILVSMAREVFTEN